MKATSFAALAAPLLALPVLLAGTQGTTPASTPTASSAEAELIAYQKPAYPIAKCVISGKALDATAIDHVVDGRLVRLCCKNCIPAVDADKAAILRRIDVAVTEAQKAAYPLKDCPISGEALADAMTPVDYVHGTRLLRFCCKDCIAEFKRTPAPTLEKLDVAYVAAQKPTYPLDTCVISGERLGEMGEPVDFLYGTRLVRLCCAGCKKGVLKDPDAALAKIDGAILARERAR